MDTPARGRRPGLSAKPGSSPKKTASKQRAIMRAPNADADIDLGARVRSIRQARGLSIEQVAGAAGLTKSFISKLEHDRVAPSVATLLKICSVLGIRAGSLFDPPSTSIVRKDQASPVSFGGRDMKEYLISGDSNDHLMALRSIIAPGGGSGEELYTLAAAADLVHIVSGQLEMTIESDVHLLDEGDTITFPPSLPHAWRNPSKDTPTIAIWVIVPPP